jgi:3-hydroxyisobutyrate dehydrogenase
MCAFSVSSGYAEKPMMLDAPVSGGVPAAEAGTLTFMV